MNWLQVLALLVGNCLVMIPIWLHLESKMFVQNHRLEDKMRDYHFKLLETLRSKK